MQVKALLLLLPAVALAGINIRIKTGTNLENASVEYVGSNDDIISDLERQTYGIGDKVLKEGIGQATGTQPENVFVRSPTPWGDLYIHNSWPQIQRTLYPVTAKILGIRSEPITVTTREFINNSKFKATYTGISQFIDQTVSNTWNKSSDLTVGQKINYSIQFGAGEIGGTTTFSYMSGWGQDTTQSQSVMIGCNNGVSVDLEPGQSVVASLTASKYTMEIELEYNARLSGYVAYNFPESYSGTKVWALDINVFLEAVHLENDKTSKEIIKIDFFTDSKVILSDPDL